MVTVSEERLSRALLLCLERAKLVVEPAGAAGVAALLDASRGGFEPPVVAVLSGGNIDPLLMMRVIRHGMAAAGRYLPVRLRAARPAGRLATLLGVLRRPRPTCSTSSTCGPTSGSALDEVEVALRLETRGPDALPRPCSRPCARRATRSVGSAPGWPVLVRRRCSSSRNPGAGIRPASISHR